MNDYPMLTRLAGAFSRVKWTDGGGMELWIDDDFGSTSTEFTPAEMLALADELRRMAQPTPAWRGPFSVTDQAAYDEGAAASRRLFGIPEKVVKREGP